MNPLREHRRPIVWREEKKESQKMIWLQQECQCRETTLEKGECGFANSFGCLGSNRLEKGGWIAIRVIVEALVES